MRILILNHFPLEGSGSGTFTKNLAASLTGAGNECMVLFPENTRQFSLPDGVQGEAIYFTDKEVIPGALPFNFPCFTSHPRSTQTFYDLTTVQRISYMVAFNKALDRAVALFQPDVVHAQHIWVWPFLAGRKGLPVVTTVHGTDLMGYERGDEFWRAIAREAVRRSGQLLTISRDSDALTAAAFPESEGKRTLIANGYDAEAFYPVEVNRAALASRYGFAHENAPLVFFAGKLTEFKGVDILLQAAAQYEKGQNPPVTLIAGDGEKRQMLEDMAAGLGLTGVHFLGNRSQTELRALYSAADVAVVPSRREPFGLVALEAMACGTTVIASNEGGLPDFVNEKVGALVPPERPDALATAILKELARPDHGDRCRAAARYALQNYSCERAITRLESVYRMAMGRAGTPVPLDTAAGMFI